MIETHGIVKRFGRVTAVDRVSFEVPSGSVCGFLGPNGAGKTTTIRIIVGVLAADAGGVLVDGHPMGADGPAGVAARRCIGFLPEESPLHPDLTVEEFVRFRADLYGVPRAERAARVDEAIRRCQVADVRRRLCGQLSKGYRQRVGLAGAIVHHPRVVVLDEPTSGLDPAQVLEFRRLLRELSEQATILLSSHVLAEVEASCDRAILIDRGRVVAQGPLTELRARGAAGAILRVECEGEALAVLQAVPGVRGARALAAEAGWHAYEVDADPAVAAELGRALARAGRPVRRLESAQAPLESVFHRLVGTAEAHG
ncbi:MAG: ABC transporter ATP-binding protein [Phycisphaerales bacterium]